MRVEKTLTNTRSYRVVTALETAERALERLAKQHDTTVQDLLEQAIADNGDGPPHLAQALTLRARILRLQNKEGGGQ